VNPPAPANQPPAAVICGPATTAVSQTVRFDGGSSSDDGDIVDYAWDFGDGMAGGGITVTHVYTGAGVYTLTLSATDDGGLTGAATHTLQVGLPPTAIITGPTAALAGQPLQFDASGSGDGDGQIVAYAWDFGHGVIGEGISVTHAYAAAGVYTLTLTVTDDDGLSASAERVVQIEEGVQGSALPATLILQAQATTPELRRPWRL
jgi:PKD repeat protein